MNKKKIYGPLARFLRAGVRPFLHRWDTSGAQIAQPPAVDVVHHRNMSGPVHTLALLPDEPRPWVLHVFLDRHECFAQYYGYTFRKRFGWPAPAAWAAAGVLSLTVPAVVRSFGAIPVYRSLVSHLSTIIIDSTCRATEEVGDLTTICDTQTQQSINA